MSIRIMSLVFQADPDKLTATQKLVLLALADFANDDGLSIYPSNERTARRTSLAVRSVQRIIRQLEEAKIVEKTRVGGGKRPNEYRIHPQRIPLTQSPTRGSTPDTESPLPLTQSHPPPDTESPDPLVIHQLNHQREKTSQQTTEERKASTKAAMLRGAAAHQGQVDLSTFPEDVTPIIQAVCTLWNLKPPRKSKRGEFAHWIEDARSLQDATGEHGVKAIQDYRKVFVDHMKQKQGVAPFTVSGPGSLIKSVRAHAGTMRGPQTAKHPSDYYQEVHQ